ncbi:hypothetical protein K461DRAFT_28744 [Myriangium duriaei CBS 260.36]|uniref:Uncharacterized protein n=1 Tax=Myriangium duriaei CBS 260.36 TaxID=1168546 RepID=A0A9P4JAR4_9PEZI|nr:hypothetical protein K461DRAFT_28744 [Myriangium duriaei CBS 260.36]
MHTTSANHLPFVYLRLVFQMLLPFSFVLTPLVTSTVRFGHLAANVVGGSGSTVFIPRPNNTPLEQVSRPRPCWSSRRSQKLQTHLVERLTNRDQPSLELRTSAVQSLDSMHSVRVTLRHSREHQGMTLVAEWTREGGITITQRDIAGPTTSLDGQGQGQAMIGMGFGQGRIELQPPRLERLDHAAISSAIR